MTPPPEREEGLKDRREVNIVGDHDAITELKFKAAELAEIGKDHEGRLRELENKRVRHLEDQQNEWRGALKNWGIWILLFQVCLNLLQMALKR